ncbi:type II secretion system F family protein [Thioclava sp. GXIMD4215]|uniref:type II secretion system F family protein n=1 Tax=Thioclava sp. GXIMD4215 TaxID=3131928 RepID=UPI003254DC75
MSALSQFLTQSLGPLGPMIALLVLAGGLILATLPFLLKRRSDPLDKIAQQRRNSQPVTATRSPAKLREGSGNDALERFAGFLEPQNEKEMSAAKKWLQSAGYRGPNAVRSFHAAQASAAIGGLALGALITVYLTLTNTDPLEPAAMIGLIMGPGVVGYFGPKQWVNSRVAARTAELQNGFPDALDMLLVCVEAGQSLNQGIIRVARELATSCPAISEEFGLIAYEIKAGKDKATVMRNFGERSGVSDIQSFATVMIQSQTFGTSIAEALRIYAADMRDKRIMRAEEAANKIPTKMTLGTMAFTVPPLLIILVGPSVYDMINSFSNF